MKKQRFPKGWHGQRVKQLIAELDARARTRSGQDPFFLLNRKLKKGPDTGS